MGGLADRTEAAEAEGVPPDASAPSTAPLSVLRSRTRAHASSSPQKRLGKPSAASGHARVPGRGDIQRGRDGGEDADLSDP